MPHWEIKAIRIMLNTVINIPIFRFPFSFTLAFSSIVSTLGRNGHCGNDSPKNNPIEINQRKSQREGNPLRANPSAGLHPLDLIFQEDRHAIISTMLRTCCQSVIISVLWDGVAASTSAIHGWRTPMTKTIAEYHRLKTLSRNTLSPASPSPIGCKMSER